MEPSDPMHCVVMDLAQMDRHHLLVFTDYYSNYILTAFLTDQRSQAMIDGLMSVFRVFRCPSKLVSDEAPNLVCYEMIEICCSKDRKAESAVKLVISLHRKTNGDSIVFGEALVT